MPSDRLPDLKFDEIKNRIALRRLGKPEDIASAVAFLGQ